MTSDLICANCQNFTFAACPPRCAPNYYRYAEADTPACARFARIPEILNYEPVSLSGLQFHERTRQERLLALGFGDSSDREVMVRAVWHWASAILPTVK